MPKSGSRAVALHRRHRMVRQMLHEHAASLSSASHANRSRRLIKCAKDSGHYRFSSLIGRSFILEEAVNSESAKDSVHYQAARSRASRCRKVAMRRRKNRVYSLTKENGLWYFVTAL
jgi:hypothetical protein